MREASDVVLIGCSDIHLQHKASIARSGEADWYEAMARPLKQLRDLKEVCQCPVVIAGDIFDKWNPPVELVNFALEHLPPCYAVPGQHDLPQHVYNHRNKSAYGVLVKSGVITDLPVGLPVRAGDCFLHGFPWGSKIVERPKDLGGLLHIAVCHKYIWAGTHKYHEADVKSTASHIPALQSYDVALFGDNHKGFVLDKGSTTIVNCGTFMRRTSPESSYQPFATLVYRDGSVVRHPLLTKDDCFRKNPELEKVVTDLDIDAFVKELNEMGDTALNFSDELKRFIDEHELNDRTKSILREFV